MAGLYYAGYALWLIGLIWMAYLAYENGDVIWMALIVVFCGLPAIIYGIIKFEQAKAPLGAIVAGIAIRVVTAFLMGGVG